MKGKAGKNLKEFIIYGVVGVSTTLVNILIYQGLLFAGVDYKIANLFALVLCKVYGYLANKNIVFRSHCDSFKELISEMLRFVFARGFTGLVDYFGLIFAVEILKADKVLSKYALQIIVILLNYVLGKFLVFRKKKGAAPEETGDVNVL